jgi:hypothetical protein
MKEKDPRCHAGRGIVVPCYCDSAASLDLLARSSHISAEDRSYGER